MNSRYSVITSEGKNELILGKLEDVNASKTEIANRLQQLIKEDGKTNPLLKAAIPIINPGWKMRGDHLSAKTSAGGITMPTKREREILKLIGEGYSTKQIAGKLFISVNTVETHRRHLLEKIKVKNSMELIKQTTNAFWLKAI